MGTDKPKPVGYTISLFVSKTSAERTETTGSGYNAETRNFPRETIELARVELRGEDLEKLLTKTRVHIDQIEEV